MVGANQCTEFVQLLLALERFVACAWLPEPKSRITSKMNHHKSLKLVTIQTKLHAESVLVVNTLKTDGT
jgi:hypothetical protein